MDTRLLGGGNGQYRLLLTETYRQMTSAAAALLHDVAKLPAQLDFGLLIMEQTKYEDKGWGMGMHKYQYFIDG